jgi:Ca2+-binding RTX toxin-like protein
VNKISSDLTVSASPEYPSLNAPRTQPCFLVAGSRENEVGDSMLTIEQMKLNLESLVTAIPKDTGLRAKTPLADVRDGMSAAQTLNGLLSTAISEQGFQSDNVIRPSEVLGMADVIHTDPRRYITLLDNHGDDEAAVETGFHKVQNDGGTLMFRGRAFIDTVADAIYHIGFAYKNGRFVNEDGTPNETAADIAGWLNYFMFGKSWVFGSGASDTLGTGKYSLIFANAAHETYDAGAGNDHIWAGNGSDRVLCGTGDDETGGGTGSDSLYGDLGNDKLWGETGNDKIFGGDGNDQIGGGDGNDTVDGGTGADQISGGTGSDAILGGAGNDKIDAGEGNNTVDGGLGNDDIYCGNGADQVHGGAGADTLTGGGGYDKIWGEDGNDIINGGDYSDRLSGGAGNDRISGGEGSDVIAPGTGVDTIELWENVKRSDTIVFAPKDSGRAPGTIDLINGFTSGQDKVDLKAFGHLVFAAIDFKGNGVGSVYYDGHYLRIDADGDRATDIMIEFSWLNKLTASDLILV